VVVRQGGEVGGAASAMGGRRAVGGTGVVELSRPKKERRRRLEVNKAEVEVVTRRQRRSRETQEVATVRKKKHAGSRGRHIARRMVVP
jgi:hypothetical protein